MQTSLPKPTKAQINRWSDAQNVGCICCALNGILGVPGDVHHLLSGGRRISHDATVLLCPYHHRSVGLTDKIKDEHGPTLDSHPEEFKQTYGTPQELQEIQEQLLTKYKESIS